MKNLECKINTETGLLLNNKLNLSPFKDDRPDGMQIDLVVVHSISLPPGKFGTDDVERFFVGGLDVSRDPYFKEIRYLRVSAHLFINRLGDMIQFVPFHKRAWHAGESSYEGRPRCNDYSIGIELEGTEDMPFEDVQYQTLAAVLRTIMLAYPGVTPERIVGHADVAPGRKMDPGKYFDWSYLKGMLT